MEHKIKKTLSRDELSRYLHTLADALQNKDAGYDPPLALLQSPFDKLEFKCKRETERFDIKLKLKTEAKAIRPAKDPETAPGLAPGDYKALKKRMQATFKEVGRAVSENRIPSQQVIQTFKEDVTAMVGFPDRGEPDYEAFEALCKDLAEACRQKRPDDIRQAFEALNKMKKDCHARYK